MANELATKNSFSAELALALNENKEALPQNFNTARFVQNSVALLNGNEALREFAQKHGTSQIKMGLLRGAYLGLDALNKEMYLVPYGSTLNFMTSYTGAIKLAKQYSVRPIRDIYAKVVHEGDTFRRGVRNGEPYLDHDEISSSDSPVTYVYALCKYADGGMVYDVMTKADIENTRSASKAKNSLTWSRYWEEMAKKTVIHRLCKTLTIDFDSKAREAFDSGLEIETDPKAMAEQEIAESANQMEYDDSIIDAESEEVFG